MAQEWTCLVCRRVLGVIRHRGMQRETKLVTTHHVRSVDVRGVTLVIRCTCGARRLASGIDVYVVSSDSR
jgi:hypothetical protein